MNLWFMNTLHRHLLSDVSNIWAVLHAWLVAYGLFQDPCQSTAMGSATRFLMPQQAAGLRAALQAAQTSVAVAAECSQRTAQGACAGIIRLR